MVQYKLYYFPGRGRAEVTRLLFAKAGVKYEDIRLAGADWAAQKPNMPLGQMPVLEVDGVKLPQSNAIARFVARRFGLAGKTEMDQFWADAFIDTLDDLGKKYPFAEKDEKKKEELKTEFFNTTGPEALKKLEKVYCDNYGGKGGFLVGEVSIADFAFMTLVDFISPMKPDILGGVPELAAVYKRVRKIPEIKAWIEKRPKSQF